MPTALIGIFPSAQGKAKPEWVPSASAAGSVTAIANRAVTLCERAIIRAERANGLPGQLLMAMGRIETGFRGHIWPWSINLQGQPRRFVNRTSAVTYLAARLEDGRRNIDAGCLQLNFQWVARGMTASEALDPDINAETAARHLASLHRRHGSWTEAVKHYHSGNPDNQHRYLCKVYAEYTRLRTGQAKKHRGCE